MRERLQLRQLRRLRNRGFLSQKLLIYAGHYAIITIVNVSHHLAQKQDSFLSVAGSNKLRQPRNYKIHYVYQALFASNRMRIVPF